MKRSNKEKTVYKYNVHDFRINNDDNDDYLNQDQLLYL